jgi:CRP-like cAMP-binding protein
MAYQDESASPALDDCLFFSNLTPEERATVLQAAERVDLRPGERLFGLGDTLQRVYLIESGEIALTLSMPIRGEDKEITLETKGNGALIGWSALVRPYQSTLGARATSPTRLISLDREALLGIYESHPRIQQVTQINVTEIIAGRLRRFEAQLIHDLTKWAAEVA